MTLSLFITSFSIANESVREAGQALFLPRIMWGRWLREVLWLPQVPVDAGGLTPLPLFFPSTLTSSEAALGCVFH